MLALRAGATLAIGWTILAGVTLAPSPAWPQTQRAVALELVLAIDASTSIDADEFDLQWRGIANAFLHPDVVGAIEAAGERGIAVAMVQWAGRGESRISVDWSLVNDRESAARFSAKISAAPRALQGFTDIGGAIRFSATAFKGNAYAGSRQVIDISGDGTSTDINNIALDRQRDIAISSGIIINGLVIYNDDSDIGDIAHNNLRAHYRDHVIGGPAAFLMVANGFEDFARAIREKLVREIIGPPIAGLQ